MRGKAIGKEWFNNDFVSGNKLYIEIESDKFKFTNAVGLIDEIVLYIFFNSFLEYICNN